MERTLFPPIAEQPSRARGDRPRCRILAADDVDEMRRVLVEILSPRYDLVGVVANGRELLQQARDLRPELLVADIAMPEMSGFDAVRQLKSDGIEPKVIFFTTNGSPLYVRQALTLGATGYVLKPLGHEELLEAVRVVLDGGTFVSPSIGMES